MGSARNFLAVSVWISFQSRVSYKMPLTVKHITTYNIDNYQQVWHTSFIWRWSETDGWTRTKLVRESAKGPVATQKEQQDFLANIYCAPHATTTSCILCMSGLKGQRKRAEFFLTRELKNIQAQLNLVKRHVLVWNTVKSNMKCSN